MDIADKRVYIGLSGGVDSAVAAALLLDAGARVTGVFIKGWYPPGMPCTWSEDRRDAMRVAAHLHIPFHTLDASAEYKRAVIDYLLAEYRAGRTPNPDVMCNREVKFGAFYRYAKGRGADAIATGHYRSGEKDQRYFLWAVPRKVFEESLFPLDGKSKPEIRALARRYRLPVADKPDSQGICFLGDISVEEFLKTEFDTRPGKTLDEAGLEVGTHGGALLYTIGERVALRSSAPGPWFVRAKDVAKNELRVGKNAADSASRVSEIAFREANWFLPASSAVSAQSRYRGPKIPGRVRGELFEPNELLVEPAAPGQSLVFYDAQGALVGGGIIA